VVTPRRRVQGADIVHIFCAEEASTPIKSFSPELIVHPVIKLCVALNVRAALKAPEVWPLRSLCCWLRTHDNMSCATVRCRGEPASVDASVNLMKDWVDRLHALVVGPGLGRDASMLDAAMQVASKASRAGLPVVLDADGTRRFAALAITSVLVHLTRCNGVFAD